MPTTEERPVSDWLPRSERLSDAEWTARHRLLCAVLAAHAPAFAAAVLLLGKGWASAVAVVAVPVLAAAAAAWLPANRGARLYAASGGLLLCSALTVQLSDGTPQAYFHYFAVVALIALYQEWTVYLLAAGFVVAQHAVLGAAYSTDGSLAGRWLWAGVHGGAVTVTAACQLVFWRHSEALRTRERDAMRLLVTGEESLLARQEQVSQARADLLGTVSHEFRTPLTAVRGAALTLKRGSAKLTTAQREDLVDSVLAGADRLGRMLENMLAAAEAAPAGSRHGARASLAAEAAAAAGALGMPKRMELLLDPDCDAAADPDALRRIAANLFDNALAHSQDGSGVVVTASAEKAWVVLTVVSTARGPVPDRLARDAFEPFVQGDGSATRDRDGAGLGLFAVRRLAEVYGGSAWMDVDGRLVIVTVRLPRAADGGRGVPSARREAAPPAKVS